MEKLASTFILDVISELGDLRKVEGEFTHFSKDYTYTAYRMNPPAGSQIIRVDIKEKS